MKTCLYWYILDEGLPPMYVYVTGKDASDATLRFTQWRVVHRCFDWSGRPVLIRDATDDEYVGDIKPSQGG